MRDAATKHEHAPPAEDDQDATRLAAIAARIPHFGRRPLGYRRTAVDSWALELVECHDDLQVEAQRLRNELASSTEHAADLAQDLRRSRAELRYWNDRSSYIESEVARARQAAQQVEREARERAERIELDAQERSLQLVDRVCTEANALLTHAREEARDMFLRFETEVDMSQQKLERLDTVRRDIASTMHGALETFEEAVRELEKVGPAKRLVDQIEEPKRRAGRTPGQDRAKVAAKRFLEQREATTAAALSSPLPKVLAASVFDAGERTHPGVTTAEQDIASSDSGADGGEMAAHAVPPSLARRAVSLGADEALGKLLADPIL